MIWFVRNILLGILLCMCMCALDSVGHPSEDTPRSISGRDAEHATESRLPSLFQFGSSPSYGRASSALLASMDDLLLTPYTTTWNITNMAITGESPDKKFSFDIYTALTGTPTDYKICAHSLRILYNDAELENPTVPSDLSVFYKQFPPSYIVPWDTMGYFYIVDTTAGSDRVIVVELDMAIMTGAYADQGYSASLLPLLSTDYEQMLCRVEFDVIHDDTFTIYDAGIEWDDVSKGTGHFDSAIARKQTDEGCQMISLDADFKVTTSTPTPTPTITPPPTTTPTPTITPPPTTTPTPTITPPPTTTPTPVMELLPNKTVVGTGDLFTMDLIVRERISDMGKLVGYVVVQTPQGAWFSFVWKHGGFVIVPGIKPAASGQVIPPLQVPLLRLTITDSLARGDYCFAAAIFHAGDRVTLYNWRSKAIYSSEATVTVR